MEEGKRWRDITSKVGEKQYPDPRWREPSSLQMPLFHPHQVPYSSMKETRVPIFHSLLLFVIVAIPQVPGYPLLTVARWQSACQGSTPTPNANAVGDVCSLLLFSVQYCVVFVPNILLSPSATYQPQVSFPSHLTHSSFPSFLARSNHGFFLSRPFLLDRCCWFSSGNRAQEGCRYFVYIEGESIFSKWRQGRLVALLLMMQITITTLAHAPFLTLPSFYPWLTWYRE